MSNTKSKSKVNKKLYAAILVAVLAVVGVAGASLIVVAPEHVAGDDLRNKTEPTASPTTSPTVTPQELHLINTNNTQPWYITDTLHMEWQLSNPVANVPVTLYNNGKFVVTAQTDSDGVAVFNRVPTVAYDYTASAELP